ncbi:MAG TPA: hypothetical protein VGG91_17010 [Myxococcaceae bacterium]|jgi:hypothetical protein
MSDQSREQGFQNRIRIGMTVLAPDGDRLGEVFEVGEQALACERGAFFAREWKVSYAEVDRVDERGVWLRHGRGSLERVSHGAYEGPTERYQASAGASPIHQWAEFDPPACGKEHHPVAESSGAATPPATDESGVPGKDTSNRH